MKIVFFGTSKFAVRSLEKLVDSKHEILAVVTQPDRPKGRSLKLAYPPIKQSAIELGIKEVFQPEELDKEFSDILKGYDADVFVVIAYGHILKQFILDLPKFYAINIHASLLPMYRGAAPINQAIIDGQTITGVTAIKMNEKMDQGDIISKKEVHIGEDKDALSLAILLSDVGGDLLIETLELIEKGADRFEKQDPLKATYVGKMKKGDGLIDWKKDSGAIRNLIRGVIPWPGAYTSISGKTLKIWKAEVVEGQKGVAGTVQRPDKQTVLVSTGKGSLKLLEVQPEAGKRMSVSAYLRGHDIAEGTVLGV